MDFDIEFKRLVGFPPMKWQARLYDDYPEEGGVKRTLDIPTGLGMTSVIVIWSEALKEDAAVAGR